MCDQLWRHLAETHGMHRDLPATWTVAQPTGFQALTRAGAFRAIASAALRTAVDAILGAGAWNAPEQWGAPLVTFPADATTRWEVPRQQWHLDFPARPPPRPLPGARVLAFVAPLEPRGGGTLV